MKKALPCPLCEKELLYDKKTEMWYHIDNGCVLSEVAIDKNWVDNNGVSDLDKWNKRVPIKI